MRPVWRVFSCCAKCIAVADILKMPLLPPDWQTSTPAPLASRVPQQGERATRAAYCQPLNKEEQPRPRWLAACGLWSVFQCSQGVPEPLKFYAKVLLFSHICKYICIKKTSLRRRLAKILQYSDFALYMKYPFSQHTHFCPI